MEKPADTIYTLQFGLVCLSSFLFSASFNMLIPELPAYLSAMGGASYKGLIIALFTLTAGFSRPFSGKLTDTIGRVPVMAVGSVVCFICGFLYPVLTTVAGFLFLRLIHGFSTGFKPTATAAYVADLVPENRWGEAMGVHGICFSTGLAIGPAIGSLITNHFSIDILFYCSSVFALMSIVILWNMKETLKEKQKLSLSLFKIKRSDIIEWRVIPAALITLLSYISYGVILTVIGDWGSFLGTANKGLFFMVFTLTSLLIRFVAGKASDTYGRILIMKISLVLLSVALLWIGLATSVFSLMSASALYGVATGMLSPSANAWTIDLSDPKHRGKAMATMYIALEAGIGFGALLAGWIFIDDIGTIPYTFFLCTGVTLLALVYLQFIWKPVKAS
ncbi:MFS transporter [Pedobacter antarcticus]|uniref:MFS transporter n=2 Tax=Pedobacter antarcticus TaxID=34086 RepID=A0A081PGB5_9SPHI|nr:MFS transporter [Pedobacter antarcticus]KEQ29738.1 MFS transporter [Pedobacter antarcticus 4BY]SDM45526.1 Predicted arabinose efflux permease, MFS family [Pedobacter antarcticus]SFE70130.1 Predicted arabinose efflux permease, MFS family [Pedobacter antarcticus]